MTVNPEIGYQWKIHNFDWIIMKLGKIAEYQLDCVKIVIFLNNGQFLVLLSFLMRHTLLSLVYQFSFYNNRNQILRNGLYEIVLPKIFDLMVIFFLQIIVSTIIFAAIVVNLLVFFGSTGDRWRRVFLMPWLIYYGIKIIL